MPAPILADGRGRGIPGAPRRKWCRARSRHCPGRQETPLHQTDTERLERVRRDHLEAGYKALRGVSVRGLAGN